MRRVVITGVGAVTPVGCGKEKFWNAIKSGVCGINTVSKFDTENFSCKVAGELTDFEITDYIEKKEARKMDDSPSMRWQRQRWRFRTAGSTLKRRTWTGWALF